MTHDIQFRPGRISDAADLAILLDAASRRLAAWFWSTMAEPGQSWPEVGRARIRGNPESPTYHSNWVVAEVDGATAGGLNCYLIPASYEAGDAARLPVNFTPMLELEAVARGTWYVQVASVFPEFRGMGIGTALLTRAEALAREAGAGRMSIIVESANERAHALYRRFGFAEWDRRPYIPFPGSDDTGEWVLLAKDIGN